MTSTDHDHDDADEEVVDAEVVDVDADAEDVDELPAVLWRALEPHDRVRALVATGGTNY